MIDPNRPDLLAEAYFLTDFGEYSLPPEHFYLASQGTKERGRNREVLEQTSKSGVVDQEFLSLKGIEISRNGIYDLLPESLFFPLSLDTLNTLDIIDAIKANRKKEEEARLFFMPFDTELFLFRAKLFQEDLFSSSIDATGYRKILKAFGLENNPLLDKDSLYFLPYLLNSFQLQEKPAVIETLLSHLLEAEVRLFTSLKEYQPNNTLGLGMGRLGVDTVLNGPFFLEELDWIIEIKVNQASVLEQAGQSHELNDAIIELVEFFAIAAREIHIQWTALEETHNPVLGSGRLGYSTII